MALTVGKSMRLSGFTLIELLVTIAVLSVILTIAVPSFQNMLVSNRLTADFNEVISALNYARSEATKRRQEVSVDISSSDNGMWKIKVSYEGQDGTSIVAMERNARDGRVEISPTGKIVFNELGRRSACFEGAGCVISVGDSPNAIVVNLSGNVDKRPNS